MGMDVYGVNPQTKTEQPTRPETENYDSDEWSAYWEARREWEQENPGTYFRNKRMVVATSLGLCQCTL